MKQGKATPWQARWAVIRRREFWLQRRLPL